MAANGIIVFQNNNENFGIMDTLPPSKYVDVCDIPWLADPFLKS